MPTAGTDAAISDEGAEPVVTSGPGHADGRRVGQGRGVLAAVLGVVAIVALMLSTVAVWAKATVFDGDKVASIVGDALAEPEVSAALATYVAEQVFTAIDVDTVLGDTLPAGLQRLVPVIAAGAQDAVDRGVARLLTNPDVQATMTELVARAHRRAMELLEGDGLVDGIAVHDGTVTLNLLPLIGRGLGRAQELGLFPELDVPELTADGDPDDQIAQLAAATGRDLPADFGQLVVYRSDRLADRQASLESAQQTVALAKRAVWLLVGVTLLSIAATVLVAGNRWRAVLWLGLGGVAGMVLIRSAVRRVVDEAPSLAPRPGGKAAIASVVSGASTSLYRLAALMLILAAVAAAVALIQRQWRRDDLVTAGAVMAFVVIVAVLGISIVSLLAGFVAAVLLPVVLRRFA